MFDGLPHRSELLHMSKGNLKFSQRRFVAHETDGGGEAEDCSLAIFEYLVVRMPLGPSKHTIMYHSYRGM